MKVLAIGDPHGKLPENLTNIIKQNNIEIIICIGEVFPITRRKDGSGKADLKKGEQIIKKINSYKIPTILLRGNMFFSNDGKKYFKNLIRKYKNIFWKNIGEISIKGKKFVIIDMIYEKHSVRRLRDEIKKSIKENKKTEEKLNKLLKKNKDIILLSHVPPI